MMRPAEQYLRPAEQYLRPAEQYLRPAEQYLRGRAMPAWVLGDRAASVAQPLPLRLKPAEPPKPLEAAVRV